MHFNKAFYTEFYNKSLINEIKIKNEVSSSNTRCIYDVM